MATCLQCGVPVAEGSQLCPSCDRLSTVAAKEGTAPKARFGTCENLIGAAAYLTFIPAVVFLLVNPFKKAPFVRFHSFQSILLAVVVFLTFLVLGLVQSAALLLVLLIATLALLGFGILWILLVVKAIQGDAFQLPIIGTLAAKQAGRSAGCRKRTYLFANLRHPW